MSYLIQEFKINDISAYLTAVDINLDENKYTNQPASCKSVTQKIYSLPEEIINSELNCDLAICDYYKNAIVKFINGHILTKNFNSIYVPKTELYNNGDFAITDEYGNVILKIKDGHILTKYFNSKIDNNTVTNNLSFLKNKDRHSINFSFDDNDDNDEVIKQCFDNNNVKCGFAIILPLSIYKTYFDEGFEILAHGTGSYSSSSTTEEQIEELLSNGKSVVESLSIKCRGFVTPSSLMNLKYHHLIKKYYDYGFSVYKGNISDPNEQTIYYDTECNKLYRIHITTLLTDYQNIIDTVVENNGVLSVYGHGYEIIENNWSINDLDMIIKYAKTKTNILTPYESFKKLYTL